MIPLSSSKLINSVLAELPESEWRVQRSNFHSFSGNSANTELISLLLESGIIGSPYSQG